MDLQPLIERTDQRTGELIHKAEDHFGILIPAIEVRYDLKGKAAGMAVFPKHANPYIRYNPYLLRSQPEEFISQTPPHEVAHLVARILHGPGIRPHGNEWKQVMAFFGAEARRCHNYSLEGNRSRQLRRFIYVCGCGRHELTSIRHNRILRGTRYLCRSCGEPLIQPSRS